MRLVVAIALAASLGSAGIGGFGGKAMAATNQELANQVREAERSFAKTMADRELGAFADHVAKESIFFGGKGPLRGRDAVVGAWARFFEGPKAPFSWEPETVEVLDSGTLALSTGPVRNALEG